MRVFENMDDAENVYNSEVSDTISLISTYSHSTANEWKQLVDAMLTYDIDPLDLVIAIEEEQNDDEDGDDDNNNYKSLKRFLGIFKSEPYYL